MWTFIERTAVSDDRDKIGAVKTRKTVGSFIIIIITVITSPSCPLSVFALTSSLF